MCPDEVFGSRPPLEIHEARSSNGVNVLVREYHALDVVWHMPDFDIFTAGAAAMLGPDRKVRVMTASRIRNMKPPGCLDWKMRPSS